jgi:IS30 family transposase
VSKPYDVDAVMTNAEIANKLGLHTNTVSDTVRRAMRKLRKNPDAWSRVRELIEMRQGLRGEHRVIKSFSKGIEL